MDQESIEWAKLSKKERKKLLKEQKIQKSLGKSNFRVNWTVVIVILILLLGAGYVWMIKSKSQTVSSKNLHAKDVPVLGRRHVDVGTKVKYNSNPPTSGDHYEVWTKNGVYDKPTEDGHLVHSLEHGYVIISHNCEMINSKLIPTKSGQNSKVGTESAKTDKECLNFVSKLKERVEKDAQKLILVPRPNLDTNFALTAWTRIEKFRIEEASMERVNSFIDSFRNQGPEKTMGVDLMLDNFSSSLV